MNGIQGNNTAVLITSHASKATQRNVSTTELLVSNVSVNQDSKEEDAKKVCESTNDTKYKCNVYFIVT